MVKDRFLLALCIGLMLSLVSCDAKEPDAGTRPRVVIHHYPQKEDHGVIKWDCPVFVGYDDGTVIWRKGWAPSISAFTITSAAQKVGEITRTFDLLMRRYADKTFTLTESSDPEITTVWVSGKKLTILGDWKLKRTINTPGPETLERTRHPDDRERTLWATLPVEIREMLTTVADFDDPKGEPWKPRKLEVQLQPPYPMRVEPIPWPAGWPQTFHVVPGTTDVLSIEFPGTMLEELLQVLPNDEEPKAVRISGKARYAEIRFILPNQTAWAVVR